VWAAFGDVPNYVEPFAGSWRCCSAADAPRIETVNDIDCYLSNFWRAVQAAPDEVARWADWPVNEADLHARHRWLVNQAEFRERMKQDPDFFDAKIAGWWVWGCASGSARVVRIAGVVEGSARGQRARQGAPAAPEGAGHQRQAAGGVDAARTLAGAPAES
jgi:hypothetical protein